MELWEYATFIPVFAFAGWPYIYIHWKRGENRFLFVSTVVGAVTVIGVLLTIFAAPFSLFLIKLGPQLAENGVIEYIRPLLSAAYKVSEWHVITIYPLLYLALPVLVYRRYGVFRFNKEGLGTAEPPPQP